MSDGCLWSQDDYDSDVWNTECGGVFYIVAGTPSENQFNYCAYCGGALTEELYGEERS